MAHVSCVLCIEISFTHFVHVLIIKIQLGVPVVYALLSDRKAVTYIHLFNILFAATRKFNKKIEPFIIMTDFEPAIEKAIRLEVMFFKIIKYYSLSKSLFYFFSSAKKQYKKVAFFILLKVSIGMYNQLVYHLTTWKIL